MLEVITSRIEIERMQNRFISRLREDFTQPIHCRVGYPGGSFEGYVYYSESLNMWYGHLNQSDKYWNGFGMGRPIAWNSNSIAGEINFPKSGTNRRIAGAFGRGGDERGIVLHRGKIGGGRTGIGKSFFLDNFTGEQEKIIDGGRESNLCIVGDLDSKVFGEQIKSFIEEIARIKIINPTDPNRFAYLLDFKYTRENDGQTVSERTDPRVINRTHGLVVHSLFKHLSAMGYRLANDRNRDLFIHENHTITVIFEIKTSSSTQSLASAMGQLLLYSIPIRNDVRLVAVLPQTLSKKVTEMFEKVGIEILYYVWQNKTPVFRNFNTLFRI